MSFLGTNIAKKTLLFSITHNLLQDYKRNLKLKIFREANASFFQSACYSSYMLKLLRKLNKTTGNVNLTYLLYKIEDTSLLLELKVIFKSRAAKNASIISEFVGLSTLILLHEFACSLYNVMKDFT